MITKSRFQIVMIASTLNKPLVFYSFSFCYSHIFPYRNEYDDISSFLFFCSPTPGVSPVVIYHFGAGGADSSRLFIVCHTLFLSRAVQIVSNRSINGVPQHHGLAQFKTRKRL